MKNKHYGFVNCFYMFTSSMELEVCLNSSVHVVCMEIVLDLIVNTGLAAQCALQQKQHHVTRRVMLVISD